MVFIDTPPDQRRRARLVRDALVDCPDKRVREAIATLPRHFFLPEGAAADAYRDAPIAIGAEQTISQPSLVAQMLAYLQIEEGQQVLDVGAGSGYVSALLAQLVGPTGQVRALERQGVLVARAQQVLAFLGLDQQVQVEHADGTETHEQRYDVIHVGCALAGEPTMLLDALQPQGRLIIPLSESSTDTVADLYLFEKQGDGTVTRSKIDDVCFVPMLSGLE